MSGNPLITSAKTSKTRKTDSAQSLLHDVVMKALLFILALLVVAVVVVAFWTQEPRPAANDSPAVSERPSPPLPSPAQSHLHDYAVKGRVPAFYETPPDARVLPNTLSPEAFTGNQRLAYQAAKEIPQVLSQLPCYCHCDRSQGHKSLHSCFESEHGEDCGICINEALMAHNLHKRGVAVSEIRKQIISAFGG